MEHVPVHNTAHAPAGRPTPQPKRSKLTTKKLAIISGVLIVLIGALVGGWVANRAGNGTGIDDDKYQAVFLTNGQVYFGRLETFKDDYLRLSDIYYLQAQSADETDSQNPQQASKNDATDVQLIKLGNEVHGPVDEMIISKDQVLFFENLKEDSKVSASIERYRQQNGQ